MHHQHPVHQLLDDAEIVRDQDQSQPVIRNDANNLAISRRRTASGDTYLIDGLPADSTPGLTAPAQIP